MIVLSFVVGYKSENRAVREIKSIKKKCVKCGALAVCIYHRDFLCREHFRLLRRDERRYNSNVTRRRV